MSSTPPNLPIAQGIESYTRSLLTFEEDYEFHSHVWTFSGLKGLNQKVLSNGLKSTPFTVRFKNYDWYVTFNCHVYFKHSVNVSGAHGYYGSNTGRTEELEVEISFWTKHDGKFEIELMNKFMADTNTIMKNQITTPTEFTLSGRKGSFKIFVGKTLPNTLDVLFSVAAGPVERTRLVHSKEVKQKTPIQLEIGKVLINKNELTDIELICDGESFKAHKAVLAARSEVFAAKFSNWNDNMESKLEVTEFKPEVIKEVLNFMYTDSISDPSLSNKIIIAADFYNMVPLKELCVENLEKSLTLHNAWSTLAVADQINAPDLKKFVSRFILDNKPNFSVNRDFEQLGKLPSSTLLELMRSLMTT